MFNNIHDFFRKNIENQIENQPELKTIHQAEVSSVIIPESKEAPVSQPDPVVKAAPAAINAEQVSFGIARAMLEAMNIGLEEIKVLAEDFFAAEKHLQPGALALFRGSQWEKCILRCRDAADAYIARQPGLVQECWQDVLGRAQATDSPEWTCLVMRNTLSKRLGEDLPETDELEQQYEQLREQEHAWRQCFIDLAGNNKAKGIRILDGEYGQCEYCIGYDYAYRVFVAFDPDDNYYHWRDYYIYPIDREKAACYLKGGVRGYPESPDPEAAKSYYKSTSKDDIKARVIC